MVRKERGRMRQLTALPVEFKDVAAKDPMIASNQKLYFRNSPILPPSR